MGSEKPSFMKESPLSSQVAKESADVLGEEPGLLEGGEVAARWHHRPALDVVDALRPRARRADDLFPEVGVGRVQLEAPAIRQWAPGVVPGVARAGGRADRTPVP